MILDHPNNLESFDYEFNAGEDLVVDMSVSLADISALKLTAELGED